jgi:predicted nucleotidyltransferase
MCQIKLHTKQDLLSAITSNREVIKGFGVSKIGLFGSFSKGTFNETSDVDLLVDFIPARKTFDNFMELSFFLEELFGRKVELVTPQSLSKFIGPYILNEVENVSLES